MNNSSYSSNSTSTSASSDSSSSSISSFIVDTNNLSSSYSSSSSSSSSTSYPPHPHPHPDHPSNSNISLNDILINSDDTPDKSKQSNKPNNSITNNNNEINDNNNNNNNITNNTDSKHKDNDKDIISSSEVDVIERDQHHNQHQHHQHSLQFQLQLQRHQELKSQIQKFHAHHHLHFHQQNSSLPLPSAPIATTSQHFHHNNQYFESTDTSSNSSFISGSSSSNFHLLSDTDDNISNSSENSERRITLQSEPVGSIPRPTYLIEAFADVRNGKLPMEALDDVFQRALIDTVHCFEQSGSKVITDGEQMKPSFITYSIDGSDQLIRGGTSIVFCDGHCREMPVLSGKNLPFRYKHYALEYYNRCRPLTDYPIKQPVISASAMSLLYPLHSSIPNYPREQFIEEMLNEVEYDIRSSLNAGAAVVQIDATEARLSMKLDPSGQLLREFITLNNRVLSRFTDEERKRIGVHSCPGGDQDSTHSADIEYELIIPSLFQLNLTRFYLEFMQENNKIAILKCIKQHIKPHHLVFFGVINVLDPRVETPEEVCTIITEIAKFIPIEQIGTTDDCGYSPFGDDMTTSRELAFAKIKSRIEGTKMAEDYFNSQLTDI